MTYHSIMEEANYAQLMTTLESVCDLSLESYQSMVTPDSSLSLILEASSKSSQSLLTFVKTAIKAVVDHITDAVNNVRIKLQKKKIDKFMSPEMRKNIEKIAAGKKIKSADGPKIKAKIAEANKYVDNYTRKLNSALSSMASSKNPDKYLTQINKLCDECDEFLKKNISEMKALAADKKELSVHDIYRFADAGIESLDDVAKLTKSIKAQEGALVKVVNAGLSKVTKMVKVVEAVGDDADDVRDIGSKVSDNKATQSAVNRAMRTAKYIGSYSSEASAMAFGIVNNLVSYDIMDTAVDQVKKSAEWFPITHKVLGPVAVATTGAKLVKMGYLKKKLSDDNKKYRQKAEEDRRMREEMRNATANQKNLHMYK